MKRLFGLIGFTCLIILTIVFYVRSEILISAIVAGSAFFIVIGFILILLRKYRDINKIILTIGMSAFVSCIMLLWYVNTIYMPVVNNFADKKLTIDGYVCEEVQLNDASAVYIIKTNRINNQDKKLKIQVTTYSNQSIDISNRVNGVIYANPVKSNILLSKGIFLSAYEDDDDFKLESLGNKQITLYGVAVSARMTMKSALSKLLSEDYASLCKAVLLGDKNALSINIKKNFTNTGMSFLIVVSGMHLAIIASFVLSVIKRFTQNRYIIFVLLLITILLFMTLVGFTSSVLRAGIMLIMTFGADVFLRKSDSLNSAGFAALLICVKNPFAVGDIGLLLSFSATMGIVLWSDRICEYIIDKLFIQKYSVKIFVKLIAVSISASLWIVPLSTIAFGRVSLYVVVISVLLEPIVSLLVICALLTVILSYLPVLGFMAYPFGMLCGLMSRYVLYIIECFSKLPYCSVNSDKLFFYVFLIIAIIFVLIGFFIKKKHIYIRITAFVSAIIFIFGFIINAEFLEKQTSMSVYNVGNGLSVSVQNNTNISFLSCGGSGYYIDDIIDKLDGKYFEIDLLLFPQDKAKYNRYQSKFLNQFDCLNILLYDKNNKNSELLYEYDSHIRNTFNDNTQFTIQLNEKVTDNILNINGITYQLIENGNIKILLVSSKGDFSVLPNEFLNVDYAIIDRIPSNFNLLSCNNLIYSGSSSNAEKYKNQLSEYCENIFITADGEINIDLG
ncbi:MAG: ComEC/Rec2 family competence protein [Ruminococcus sp.]|nr:ComEC/Rec2 family competence protein [Ruminococcus sp.]